MTLDPLALQKTEELMNALEAIRGRCGILEGQLHIVWEAYQSYTRGNRFTEDPLVRTLLPMIQQLTGEPAPAAPAPRRRRGR